MKPRHLFRAPGLGRQKVDKAGHHRQHCRRRPGPREQRPAEFAQKEDQRHLAGLVGELPSPDPLRIGAAEGALHRDAQAQGVDAKTLSQIELQGLGDAEDLGRDIRCCEMTDRRKHGRNKRLKRHRNLRDEEQGQAGRRSLASPPACPSPALLCLSHPSFAGRGLKMFPICSISWLRPARESHDGCCHVCSARHPAPNVSGSRRPSV